MFEMKTSDGVVFFTSDILGVKHAFSTRIGGVSTLPHTAELNVSYTSGGDAGADSADIVTENRRRLAAACGIMPPYAAGDYIFTLATKQLHSDIIEYITPDNAANDFYCDGFVTDSPLVTVAVKTADCVPILLADAGAGIVSAIHAGWRGTAAGIAALAVEKMLRYGAKLHHIKAAIGPAIGTCCYTVAPDFKETFIKMMLKSRSEVTRASSEKAAEFFTVLTGTDRADLKAINRLILKSSGIKSENIDICSLCTYCSPDLFYSHRRQGASFGVMGAIITPNPIDSDI